MHIDHHTIRSPVFEEVGTFEFDVALGEDTFPIRVELFRSLSESTTFRAHLWQLEMFRVQSVFPQDSRGRPLDEPSGETLLREQSTLCKSDVSEFEASSTAEALEHVSAQFKGFLEHAFGQGQD